MFFGEAGVPGTAPSQLRLGGPRRSRARPSRSLRRCHARFFLPGSRALDCRVHGFDVLHALHRKPVFKSFQPLFAVNFHAVEPGRATWLDGVKVYGEKGLKALEDWLSVEGVKNIEAVNAAVKGATSWKKKAGVATA